MRCPYCENDVPIGENTCPSCGANVPNNIQQHSAETAFSTRSVQAQQFVERGPAKSKVAYVLLGLFLGIFGIHNFYAGYFGRGIVQLLLTLLSCFILGIVTGLWALIEVCVVDKDANGISFA